MRTLLYAAPIAALLAAGAIGLTGTSESPLLWPAARAGAGQKWVTAWTASMQGPYPRGFALLQPDLSLLFPDPARGAKAQSFRMIVHPDLWGNRARIRLSNAFGLRPIRFENIAIGLQFESSGLVAGTNQAITFNGKNGVGIAPGEDAWSDAVTLPFVPAQDPGLLLGRRLAVSFYIPGESGPMTWHAKALTTSYLTKPNTPAQSAKEDEAAFPFSTTSVFFLSAVDMMADPDTRLVVAFGDSLTDGMGASLNGQDRWPDVLSRRLHARFGNKVAVVNAGIAGNQILKPAPYDADPGGPAALDRIERDILSLSGVSAVIWLEGTNDLGPYGQASLAALEGGFVTGVKKLRSRIPAVRLIGATLIPAIGNDEFGARDEDRKALNAFIKESPLFDAAIDFDAATAQAEGGGLKPEFVLPSNGISQADHLHPNRAGYLAMAQTADPSTLLKDTAAEPKLSQPGADSPSFERPLLDLALEALFGPEPAPATPPWIAEAAPAQANDAAPKARITP